MWIERLTELGDAKYPEQIAFLRENHGFSQAHANALVMYTRNSPSSKRFRTPDEYFANIDPVAAATARSIFAALTSTFPELELVVAWNQPMLRNEQGYVLGLSTTTRHLLLNPFSATVLTDFAAQLSAYEVNKNTFRVPLDWKVDETLVRALVAARLAEMV